MPQEFASSQHHSATQESLESQDSQQVLTNAMLSETEESLDDLLDDIEASLETNAQEYVARFVQKGGE